MEIKITTLSENTAARMGLLAEWGLSILVEVDGLQILLDTSQGFAAAHNARALGIDLSTVSWIVLSHGHRDHTGGLREILDSMKKTIDIIAHPDIWAAKYSGTFQREAEYAGIPFMREELERLGASFVLTREPVWLTDEIVTTGEIPMTTDYEEIDRNLYVREGGELHPDPLWDDRALIIDTEQGLVVITGCAHRGIINTLRHAQQLTGVEQINTVIGGTHLIRASEERIELTIAALKEFGLQRLGVSHCTGFAASVRLAEEFGEIFFPNNAGTRLTLQV
jgi:7,8-dihydropterin-6-yl-methyl-4-(beta-D-ribofuranosyl)aminobenzene 5'-phosphate synthase